MNTIKRIKVVLLAILFAVIASGVVITVGILLNLGRQQLDYTEDTRRVSNPDQGFYRPLYVKVTADDVEYNKNVVTESTQLYHLRIDISAFSAKVNGSADGELTAAALDGLDGALAYLKSRGKNAVVRFAYDPQFGGKNHIEPAFDMLLKHVGQFCPVLNRFESTITAIEAGLIGPWGEMHTSDYADSGHTTQLIAALLDNTVNLPVLVRTPKKIYDYLGVTAEEAADYDFSANPKAARLGMFNDGYLGSESDLGTYQNRERDTAFLAKINERLPYGGEVVIPDSPLHNIENCLPEMFALSLSYLNVEWNNNVIDKWKATEYSKACGGDKAYYGKTAFEYIENRFGYRFVLRDAVLKMRGGEFSAKLDIENVGFGNMLKDKKVRLIFARSDGEKFEIGAGIYRGERTFEIFAEVGLPAGEYEVFLLLYGDEFDGAPIYTVQFSNPDIWSEDLSANRIGKISV